MNLNGKAIILECGSWAMKEWVGILREASFLHIFLTILPRRLIIPVNRIEWQWRKYLVGTRNHFECTYKNDVNGMICTISLLEIWAH